MSETNDQESIECETTAAPINMLLFCPVCARQHIDAPDPEEAWDNPPHRSHLCRGCGTTWRPADVPTNGVAALQTRGAEDNWSIEEHTEAPFADFLNCRRLLVTAADLAVIAVEKIDLQAARDREQFNVRKHNAGR